MKNLEANAIPQLLSILPNHPALSLMQFAQEDDAVAHALKELAVNKEYEFLLNITEKENLEKSKLLEEENICRVKAIKWQQRRYASMGTLYYNVFVTAPVPKEHRETFLSNVLYHIKTAGHICFFLEKNNYKELDEWWALLEEKMLVAISTLDISEEFTILLGKKMHGWDSSFK